MKNFLRTAALYLFHLGFVRPVLTWIVGVRYRRRSLIPDGPCLVVSNHNSHLDAGVLMSLFPLRRLPRVHPVAAADYFGSTIFKQALAMWMMNSIPIQRHPKPGVDPLQPLIDKLNEVHSLGFF
ncbi:MAG: 1-acyl-sn-glycerol-3-phosphate acyltransferase, partial [Acidobacteria bacterium]|nr:1-acyl-sn-glycerol-3-phosphate acyltransferase [Acidobacteriota bacterium]